MNLRLDRESRERKLHPKLPPPLIEHSAESRAKVRAMVEELVERTAADLEESDMTARRNRVLARTNARFTPDMDPEAVRRRLGFSAGDPEDHEAAA